MHPFEAVDADAWGSVSPSWGHFQVGLILRHLDRLARYQPAAPVGDELRAILLEAVPLLNRTPSPLVHNDAHPWNVLVCPTPNGWRCSGWLDWEYAWIADPTWNLMQMDLIRRTDIGPTPRAFWEGYGGPSREPQRSVYALYLHLSMAARYLDGDRR